MKDVKLPVRTDSYGMYIYDAESKMLAQIRGFGWMKQLVGEDKAHDLQKELAEFLVQRINRSLTDATDN